MIQIDRERCTGCAACMEVCPSGAIEIHEGLAHVLAEHCTDCGTCAEVCPQDAVRLLPELGSPKRTLAKPEGQPADRSQEIITVRVPPAPTLVPARPSPARQLGLAVGTALSFFGREVAPRLARLAVDWMEQQLRTPRGSPTGSIRRPSAQGGGGQRRRRQRRGRR